MIGELAFQFRNWMRPNWNRYFGTRFGKQQFSESLGSYRKGTFISVYDFLTIPIKNQRTYRVIGEDDGKSAMINILSGYKDLLFNAKYYYNTLSLEDKANLKRAFANLGQLLTVSAAIAIASAMIGGDDDDKEEKIRNNFGLSLYMYELSGLQSDLAQFLPTSWIPTLKKTKENTIAGETFISNIFTGLYNLASYPFLDEEDAIYQTGIYRGKSKVEVDFWTKTPILRQIYRFETLPSQTARIKAYSNIDNLFGIK